MTDPSTLDASTLGLFSGAIGLGLLHALEPGHGWPVAAAWALTRRARWSAGVLAACVIGVGHLVSSIAMVALFFAAQSWLDLVGMPWIEILAGVLLLGLAAWQLRAALGGHAHHHHHGEEHGGAGSPSLASLAVFALTLGFAHQEEFQIIGLCAGSAHCLSLMLSYALAVIGALIALTLLLVAGLSQLGHRMEHAQRTLTLLSAGILALMGIGFLAGFL